MRQIGSLETESEARSFFSYLVTQQIRAQIEEDEGKWLVWIHEEDEVPRGREELAAFRENPGDEKYVAALAAAEKLAKQKAQETRQSRHREVKVRDRWDQPLYRRVPVTAAIVTICVFVAVITTSIESNARMGMMGPPICNKPSAQILKISGTRSKTLPEVRYGQFWRLITPIFLHGSVLHIFMNLMWMQAMGGLVEMNRGRLKYIGIILVTALISNLAQNFFVGPNFVGISGVGFGLFGYVFIKSRYEPKLGLYMSQNMFAYGLFFILLGFAGFMRMANAAHVAGLLAGMGIAYLSVAARKLKKNLS